jgi:hypothetical protein
LSMTPPSLEPQPESVGFQLKGLDYNEGMIIKSKLFLLGFVSFDILVCIAHQYRHYPGGY